MNHRGSQKLESQRLILRPFEMSDVDQAYQHWTSDPVVSKYLTWPNHQSPAVTKAVIAQWVANYSHKDFYQWAIVLKSTHEVIGSISVVDVKEKLRPSTLAMLSVKTGGEWELPPKPSNALFPSSSMR